MPVPGTIEIPAGLSSERNPPWPCLVGSLAPPASSLSVSRWQPCPVAPGSGPGHHRSHPRHGHGFHRATVVRRHGDAAATSRPTPQRSLTTNASGVSMSATLLRVGNYDVSARALGFRESSRGQRCGSDWARRSTLNFALAPQVVQLQELTVAAEPALDVTELGLGHPAERRGGRRVCPTTAATSSTSPR